MAFASETNGQPTTTVYFQEAIIGLVDSLFEKTGRGFFRPSLQYYCQSHPEKVLKVVLTPLGRQMFLDAKKLILLKSLLNPIKFNAKKIGEGSEGDVFIYQIWGQNYAVKLYSAETQRRVNEAAAVWRLFFPQPDFTERLGYAQALIAFIQDFPKQTFVLSTLKEYAAGTSFIMTELGPTLTATDLFTAAGIKRSSKTISEEANSFLVKNHILSEQLRQLRRELTALNDICTLKRFFGLWFPDSALGRHDFTGKNLLVRGFDRVSKKFDLVLIDQGQSDSMSSMDPTFIDYEMLRQAQKCYARLRFITEYRQYLEKYDLRRPVGADVGFES